VESKFREEARGRDAPQKRVYKHALERIGVRVVLRAVKRADLRFGPVWHRKVPGRRGWNATSICTSSQESDTA